MSRKKIKQVDAIRQKTLENVIEEFLRHCRLKNLSPRTLEYYEEDLSYFQRSVPVESVREVTREVMEDFIDHEMQKGNRITAINTRLRGLRVFFRFCQEREYMGDIPFWFSVFSFTLYSLVVSLNLVSVLYSMGCPINSPLHFAFHCCLVIPVYYAGSNGGIYNAVVAAAQNYDLGINNCYP